MIRSALFLSGIVVLSACAPDPLGRETFVTRETQTVLYLGQADPFEVRFKAGNGPSDYWCAAGRYAAFASVSPTTRIYRLSPSPRPQGEGVTFSFTRPAGGGQATGLVTVGGSDSLSASAARQQCDVLRSQRFDF